MSHLRSQRSSSACRRQLGCPCLRRPSATPRLRRVMLVLPALALATSGCLSTQRQARQEATERWNQVRAQVKVKLASDQLAAGHVEDAATELAEAFRLDPDNLRLLLLQARVHLARADHVAAQRVLESIEAEAADSELRAEVDYLLGIIQQQLLHWDEAFNHFVRAATEAPHEVAYLVAIVQNMLQLGEAQEALEFLRSHEAEFGWTGAYQAALAECCEQLEEWQAATAAWEKVADASGVPFVRERLAMALYRCGRWPEAITHLQGLLDEGVTQPLAPLRLALARCLLETHRPAEAQAQLGLVLRDDPQNTPALQLLARVFAQQGQFERARRTAEHALRLAPDDPQVLELAAALAFRSGEKDRARSLAQRILRDASDAESPVAAYILAQSPAAQQ